MQALIECEGDAIDLSGDMGAVGRIIVSDTPSGNHDLYLDLKGKLKCAVSLRLMMIHGSSSIIRLYEYIIISFCL